MLSEAHLPMAEQGERRMTPRIPLDLPICLRLGVKQYSGYSRNLGVGGVSLRLDYSTISETAPITAILTSERGALELLVGDIRFVVGVRVAHVLCRHTDEHVGLAIEDKLDAERLMHRLRACGIYSD
jgi:hypothetical protein